MRSLTFSRSIIKGGVTRVYILVSLHMRLRLIVLIRGIAYTYLYGFKMAFGS